MPWKWRYMYKNREVIVIASNDERDIRIITAMTGNREREGEWRWGCRDGFECREGVKRSIGKTRRIVALLCGFYYDVKQVA
jgi:hypothetical protein